VLDCQSVPEDMEEGQTITDGINEYGPADAGKMFVLRQNALFGHSR
jgi:hypothetical protein